MLPHNRGVRQATEFADSTRMLTAAAESICAARTLRWKDKVVRSNLIGGAEDSSNYKSKLLRTLWPLALRLVCVERGTMLSTLRRTTGLILICQIGCGGNAPTTTTPADIQLGVNECNAIDNQRTRGNMLAAGGGFLGGASGAVTLSQIDEDDKDLAHAAGWAAVAGGIVAAIGVALSSGQNERYDQKRCKDIYDAEARYRLSKLPAEARMTGERDSGTEMGWSNVARDAGPIPLEPGTSSSGTPDHKK
jgi:hypothetical protein